ncbi:MAG: nitroreductase family protein [Victivallaceae bacterium]|nr:nitroreductase family protein [Victivallaceae bacterium]
MDFTKLTQTRYSVRKFKPDAVPEEHIQAILEMAHNAPTACNKQPQRVFVMESEAGRAKIRRTTQCHFDAPLFFVVCYDRKESWHRDFDGQDYGMVDSTIVLTQMMLKIQEVGLGSCFVAWFDPAALRKELELPENVIPVGILPCGYPADDSRPVPQHSQKKKLSEITCRK